MPPCGGQIAAFVGLAVAIVGLVGCGGDASLGGPRPIAEPPRPQTHDRASPGTHEVVKQTVEVVWPESVVPAAEIFVEHPELSFPRRASLVNAGVVRLQREGPIVWSPSVGGASFLSVNRIELPVLEASPALVRVLVERDGLRLALYLDTTDFELSPTRAVELLPSEGAPYLDGFVLVRPGASVELGEGGGALREITLRIPAAWRIGGLVPEGSLGVVYTPLPDGAFEPDMDVTGAHNVLEAPHGRVMATLVGDSDRPLRLAALGEPTDGYRYVRLEGGRCVVQGWLELAPVRVAHRTRAPNLRMSVAPQSRLDLPPGTPLYVSPSGPQIGVTLATVIVRDERETSGLWRKIAVFPEIWGALPVWIQDPRK